MQISSQSRKVLAVVALLFLAVALWLLRSGGTSRLPVTSAIEWPNHERAAKIDRVVQSANVPIKFWGKVVESDGKPISGAKIEIGVQQVYSPFFGAVSESGKIRTMETGADGLFSMSGESGLSLNIRSVTKSGYRLSKRAKTSFAYAGSPYLHIPRQEAPIVFVMLREGAQEQLVHKLSNMYVPCDGTPVAFNLFTGKAETAGQFRTSFRRVPEHITLGQPFSWSATFEVMGGAIMEMPDDAAYIAPESGWTQKVVIEKAAQDAKWQSGFNRTVYVRTADGKYGRVSISFNGDFEPPPTVCTLEVFMNPSGSRNLEGE